jgi:hypothetical protein
MKLKRTEEHFYFSLFCFFFSYFFLSSSFISSFFFYFFIHHFSCSSELLSNIVPRQDLPHNLNSSLEVFNFSHAYFFASIGGFLWF